MVNASVRQSKGSLLSELFEIQLPCTTTIAGRPIAVSIRLTSLHQSLTYGGLIEGLPNENMNQRIIDSAIRHAQKTYSHVAPHLFAPKQKPLDIGREYPFGKPATIPAVQCIAMFESYFPTARSPKRDCSAMSFVWFQNKFAMPIDEEIMTNLCTVDWLNLATDLDY